MPRLLSSIESNSLREMLRKAWAWDTKYWYPLASVQREDVVGFDAPKLEKLLPQATLRELILNLGAADVFLIHEYDADEQVHISDVPQLYGWSETFMVSDQFDWVVYWSHEETITFGGRSIIRSVCSAVPDWKSALWP